MFSRESIPMSLRKDSSELAYQNAKIAGQLRNLHDEDVLHTFKHFVVIENRYPYDSAYQKCHMLIPARVVSAYEELRWYERRELRKIIDGHFVQANYDQIVENTYATRSVKNVWHIHLLKFKSNRRDFII